MPTNVQTFLNTQAGQHLLLLLIEHSLNNALKQIYPLERDVLAREYAYDLTTGSDFELLLDHLSLVRVVTYQNNRAEEALVNYWGSNQEAIHLADARQYTIDVLRIAPVDHPEQGRAYKNLAYIFFARNKTKSACASIEKALNIFQKNGLTDPLEELVEMLTDRNEPECKRTMENSDAALRSMNAGRSGR
ncbi:hypothetical protein [Tumebacillus flagellatus]|uniref:hypothetical protein n=1 Tax=Tumebacillus flagellatus TaxID=1157490 RepID=UPI0012689156|nr:hypothetical protein [Tumebacillus flagellatus]